MVDLEYLENIRLVSNPLGQRIIASLLLTTNYRLFADVDVRLENEDRIPRGETVIFAMNHTDRYNYWPFQWKMWSEKRFPFTTVWVKGKYYRNAMLGKFFDWCNLIPVPSRGYLVEEFYSRNFKKRIDKNEYRLIKDVIDGKNQIGEVMKKLTPEAAHLLKDNFLEFVRNYHEQLMSRVAELSRKALFVNEPQHDHFSRGDALAETGGRQDGPRAARPPYREKDRSRGVQQFRPGLFGAPSLCPERLYHLPGRGTALGGPSTEGIQNQRRLHPFFKRVSGKIQEAVRRCDPCRHGQHQ